MDKIFPSGGKDGCSNQPGDTFIDIKDIGFLLSVNKL